MKGIKKQSFLLKLALVFMFVFVTFAGHNFDYKNNTVYKEVTAKSRPSSGGFKSSGFKSSGFSSKPKSSSPSSGFNSGGFKNSDSNSSSKGYSSGGFKDSKSDSSSSSSSGYGSGSFKESKTPKTDSSPKVDNSKNYKKGGSNAFPVPIPFGGFSPFGFGLSRGGSIVGFIVSAIAITLLVIAAYAVYKRIRNRRQ